MIALRSRKSGLIALLCAGAAGTLLAGCATAPPAPPPVVYVPPVVMLPDRLMQAAAAYAAYVDSAAAFRADFTDGDMVASELKSGAAYEARQFQRGEGAYAAIVALQDPAFVAGVRVYGADPAQRATVVGELIKDPAYAIGIKGSDSAAGLVIAALSAQGNGVLGAGEKVKQSAYDLQKRPWSLAPVADRDGRLAAAKAQSLLPMAASAEDMQPLQSAVSGQTALAVSGAPVAPPYTPLVARALAVAALAVLGEGRESNADTLWAMLEEPNQALCFNMSKLNLYQCLAVAKPYYEDMFCLGQHVLMDTGQCINRASGVFTPPPAMQEHPTATAYQPPGVAKKGRPHRRKAEGKPAGDASAKAEKL